MWLFPVRKIAKKFGRGEAGVSLIETVVALAVLSTVAVTFLSGLATTSKAVFIADTQATAESLARSQMEWVKKADYVYEATQYPSAPISGDKDYLNYSVVITAQPLSNPDDGIQKITITVKRSEKVIIRLEGYKVDR